MMFDRNDCEAFWVNKCLLKYSEMTNFALILYNILDVINFVRGRIFQCLLSIQK